jgi:hypothetical protein
MLNFHRQYFYGMTFFSNKFYVSFSNESATRISTHSVRAQEGWLNTGILLKTKQKKLGKKSLDILPLQIRNGVGSKSQTRSSKKKLCIHQIRILNTAESYHCYAGSAQKLPQNKLKVKC